MTLIPVPDGQENGPSGTEPDKFGRGGKMTNLILILVMLLAVILGFLFSLKLIGLITRPRDKKHRGFAGQMPKRGLKGNRG